MQELLSRGGLLKDPLQWCDNRNIKIGSACPEFKCKVSNKIPTNTPSSVSEELRRRGIAVTEKGIHVKAHTYNDRGTPYVPLLKACTQNKDLHEGVKLHKEILNKGLLGKYLDALIIMYAKCGAIGKAQALIESHKRRSVFSWTAIISGYARQGQGQAALDCFDRMLAEGLSPDAVTFACILKACGSIKAAGKGEQIHDEITRQGLLGNDIVLGTALVDMYAKCGALTKAQGLLEKLPSRDVASWNAIITGYAQHGQGQQALNCFDHMKQEGLSPNAITFTSILKACSLLGDVSKGEQIHDEVIRQGLLKGDTILGNVVVDMYVKCGALAQARQVLEELPYRDVISWNTLLAGYAQQGKFEEALNYFEQMQYEGLAPDEVTFACILKACGNIGAGKKGVQIHDEIVTRGLLRNGVVLSTHLVEMYAKCGTLAKAQSVLDEILSRDAVSWNALIAGYAQQGQGEQALKCVDQMQQEGIPPDDMTFSCVLYACSHLGLLEEGYTCFVDMSTRYGINPNLEHYTCMVDLFGRAGHLGKAVGLIGEMPSTNYSAFWVALLGACWRWRDVNVGRWAFEQAVQVDKRDSVSYVLMTNLYAIVGMHKDAEIIEAMKIHNIAHEKPTCWNDAPSKLFCRNAWG